MRNGSTWVVTYSGLAPTTNNILTYNGGSAVWANPASVTGVSTATANTLAQRDSSAGCAFGQLNCANLTVGGTNIQLTSSLSPTLMANGGNAILAGYANVSGNFFPDTVTGDMIYRNTAGSLRFGTSTGASQMQITSSGVGVTGIFNIGSFSTFGSTSITVPTSTSSRNCVQFLQLNAGWGGYTVEISTAVSSSSFSESTIYRVLIQYGSTGGVWQSLTPDKYSPSFGSYRVDVLSLTNTTNFRLVRVNGTVAGTAFISARVFAGSDLSFTFQSTVSTDTTIPAVYDDGRPGKLYSSIIPYASSVTTTGTYGQVNITYINLPVGNFDIWGNVSVNCSSAIMYQAGAWVEAPGGTTPDQCYRAYSSSSGTTNISLTIPTRNITVTTPISIYMVISYSTTASATITICGSLYARRF